MGNAICGESWHSSPCFCSKEEPFLVEDMKVCAVLAVPYAVRWSTQAKPCGFAVCLHSRAYVSLPRTILPHTGQESLFSYSLEARHSKPMPPSHELFGEYAFSCAVESFAVKGNLKRKCGTQAKPSASPCDRIAPTGTANNITAHNPPTFTRGVSTGISQA